MNESDKNKMQKRKSVQKEDDRIYITLDELAFGLARAFSSMSIDKQREMRPDLFDENGDRRSYEPGDLVTES